jgi:hypothetical protein
MSEYVAGNIVPKVCSFLPIACSECPQAKDSQEDPFKEIFYFVSGTS